MLSLVLALANTICFVISYTNGAYGLAAFNAAVAGWCASAAAFELTR